MNWKSFVRKIGFAVTLVGLSLTIEGYLKIFDLIAAGIIALVAITLLFTNVSTKPAWKSFIHWASEEFDLTYIAFSFGLTSTGSNILRSGWSWEGFLLFAAGVLFASYAIGDFIGKSFAKSLKVDPRIGITFGFLYLIVGVMWFIMAWNSILEKPQLNAPGPVTIIILGILFICFGCLKWQKSHPHEKKLQS
jgi:hypothetical protein